MNLETAPTCESNFYRFCPGLQAYVANCNAGERADARARPTEFIYAGPVMRPSSLLALFALTALGLPALSACRGEPEATGSSSKASAGGGAGDGGAGGQGGSSTASLGPGGGGGPPVDPGELWPRPGCDASPAPVIEKAIPEATPRALALKGVVVTPTQTFEGEVLVVGDRIACAAPSCSSSPDYAGAGVVRTNGIIFPGLIDTHNHVLFNVFDETDWTPLKAHVHHDDWPREKRYGAMVDAKQWLNGEGQNTAELNCELNKYGELKGVLGGTTSMVGAANPANKKCYGSLARTIDQRSNDLDADRVQAGTLFPGTESADAICDNITDGTTKAYLIHVAEGTNERARGEFYNLGTVTTAPECLYSPVTTIVHGTALGEGEFKMMADRGMSLVWSPKSNVFLYGQGVDMTQTTNVPLVRSLGIRIALAPDWSLGGSINLLDELRFADAVDAAVFGDVFTIEELTRMVTIDAATIVGFSDLVGSIEPGKMADLLVIEGDASDPYGSLMRARPENVRLVMVGGAILTGDSRLIDLVPPDPACEPLQVCCASKFVCFAEAEGDADKLTQTLSEVTTLLSKALEEYDQKDLSEWDFAPIAPLVKCE